MRADLADDLRAWIAGRESIRPDMLLFDVPTGLRRILDRDLKAAGIPKRDDRGRTVDVHALRTTFGTWLSTTGTAPRTAQAAMRHSDMKLTMGVYTDPRLLDIRGAVEKLPSLTLPKSDPRLVAPPVAPTPCNLGHIEAITGKMGRENESESTDGAPTVSACPVNEKAPESSIDISRASIGLTGFEPATSWSRTKRSTKLSYSPLL